MKRSQKAKHSRPAPPTVRRSPPKARRSVREPTAATQRVPEPTAESVGEVRPRKKRVFPIVGIGASAGGLEALELFLKNVPERSGLAFVVIQHQHSTQKSIMVELLQRRSAIPVVQAKDRLPVEPDHVYVIPPNQDLSILHGVLHLFPQVTPRGLNLPIDYFFRSLAEDQQERSIGVILSGMGSDGTLGLRVIKEKAGAVFAQALSSAKFDSMPRSAIDAGLADVVAPVEELPGKIIAYLQHLPSGGRHDASREKLSQSALEKVLILVRTQIGNDFSLYKRNTIYRRIERRMGLHQIDQIADYVRYLRENPRETELLGQELLIGVTSFFRDPAAWEQVKREVMPALLSASASGGTLRAWVPGCSTGEEAYSLAIVFKEVLEKLEPVKNITLQVYATDLDDDAIQKARRGVYPDSIAAAVSLERLRRFFIQEEHRYRVGEEIREMVIFAPQNLIADPPFTKLDFLSCRNLLIYLAPELQKKLIPLFHYCLNPGGILFLGSAETIGACSDLFSPLDGKTRLYRRLEFTAGAVPVDFPASFASASSAGSSEFRSESPAAIKVNPPNLQTLADRVLVQRFSPAAVLTSDQGDILYVSGRTGKYLEPPAGRVNWNVFAMAREGLQYELSSAFSTALREARVVTMTDVKVGTNGGTQTVNITVQKLTEPEPLRGTVMIVFADAPARPETARPGRTHRAAALGGQPVAIEKDLQLAREEVRAIREEMQTSQEEIRSTNEELQSTNEELTTSKEEMQSLNEELQTVNHELQAKLDELSRSNNDMKNLLNSTDIATLFLDNELRVRRFTTQMAKIIKLIPGDAGRPITDIASELDYPGLVDDAREVLRSLVFQEKLVAARYGQWFAVRIMPYRTLENVIDGVVITFTDVTASKSLEKALRKQVSQWPQLAESLPLQVWGCRPDGACNYLSRQWIEYTGVPESEGLGFGWLGQVHSEDRERAREEWNSAIQSGTTLELEYRIRGRDGVYHWFRSRAVPIRDTQGNIVQWYGANSDIEDLKQVAKARQRAAERLASILEGIQEPFFALDDELVVTYVNSAAEQMFERPRDRVLGKPLFEAFIEVQGSIFEEKCHQAVRERVPLSFEAHFETASYRGGYRIRVCPHKEGISVFFQRNIESSDSIGS